MIKQLCKWFGHKWGVTRVIWPNEYGWLVYCKRCGFYLPFFFLNHSTTSTVPDEVDDVVKAKPPILVRIRTWFQCGFINK